MKRGYFMKFKFKRKYIEIGIMTFLVVAASLVFYYFLFHHTTLFAGFSKVFKIISPVVYGFIFVINVVIFIKIVLPKYKIAFTE
jgi:hypothetical protein